VAYNTLIQPSTKLNYDMSKKTTDLSHYTYEDNLNAVDIFEQVIRQVINAFFCKMYVCTYQTDNGDRYILKLWKASFKHYAPLFVS
jgi:hypothetical protein